MQCRRLLTCVPPILTFLAAAEASSIRTTLCHMPGGERSALCEEGLLQSSAQFCGTPTSADTSRPGVSLAVKCFPVELCLPKASSIWLSAAVAIDET